LITARRGESFTLAMRPGVNAHDLVCYVCRDRAALKQKRPLIDLPAEHPEINKHVTRAQLATFCDPMNNLGQAGVMVDRVLASLKA
jgi:3-carboxy-cis,cis-muconate cycloisomerase